MGHDQSRPSSVHQNFEFSIKNKRSIFEAGFEEEIFFISDLFKNDEKEKEFLYPPEDIIINSILNPSLFIGNMSTRNISDVWKSIIIPLFIGNNENKPQIQQLLLSFSEYLDEKSNLMYSNEITMRASRYEQINEKKIKVISFHNPKTQQKGSEIISEKDILNIQQGNVDNAIESVDSIISKLIDKRCKKTHNSSPLFLKFSNAICDLLKKNPNHKMLPYTLIKWGFAASELSPLIDGFVELTKQAINNSPSSNKILFYLLSSDLLSSSLANCIFVPSPDAIVAWDILYGVEYISKKPNDSSDAKNIKGSKKTKNKFVNSRSTNLICASQGSLFVLDKNIEISCLNSKCIQDKEKIQLFGNNHNSNIDHLIKNKDDSVQNKIKKIQIDDSKLCVSLTASYNTILAYNNGDIILIDSKTKQIINEHITYESEVGVLKRSPKLKPPFSSDGHYIYSMDSHKRIAVFSIKEPPKIVFHRYIEFTQNRASVTGVTSISNASLMSEYFSEKLLPPFDRYLVPKEWITDPSLMVFTNGIIFTIMIFYVPKTENLFNTYFMRHFSLVDGHHICDNIISLKFPIYSLSIDPWNNCIWGATRSWSTSSNSPKNESLHTNNICIIKFELYNSYPPSFLGLENYPILSFQNIINLLNESSDNDSTSYSISQIINYFSYHSSGNLFEASLYNPHYNSDISLIFSPCTNESISSILNGIIFLKDSICNNIKSTKYWNTNAFKATLLSLLRLLELNLRNFNNRILDPNKGKINNKNTQEESDEKRNFSYADNVVKLEQNNIDKIIEILLFFLKSTDFSSFHRYISYLFVKCILLLFSGQKYDQFNIIFEIIIKKNSNDFLYFMFNEFAEKKVLPYCFSSSSEIFKLILEPNNDDLCLIFQRELCYELYCIYYNNPSESSSKSKDHINKLFSKYSNLIIDKMTSIIQTNEFSSLKYQLFINEFKRYLILINPFTKSSNISSLNCQFLKPLFISFVESSQTINQKTNKNANSLKLNFMAQIYDQSTTTFNPYYQMFFQISSILFDSLVSILKGGTELYDPSKYSWLIKATINSKIALDQIAQFAHTFFNALKTESTENSIKGNNLPQKPITFSNGSASTFGDQGDDDLLNSMIALNENEQIKSLFDFLYSSVTCRINQTFSNDIRPIERIIFAAYMKQLGFSKDVLKLVQYLATNKGNINTSNSSTILTPFIKSSIETLYKIRTTIFLSYQSSRQIMNMNFESNSMSNSSPSLSTNFSAYKIEIFKKAIFLIHIQPCMRFQKGQTFNQTNQNVSIDFSIFSDYLKRIENFLISEITLEQYYALIIQTEETRNNSLMSLNTIYTILNGNAAYPIKLFLIEKMVTNQHIFRFISILNDDSYAENGIHILLNILNNFQCLMKTAYNDYQNKKGNIDSNIFVLYLNILMIIQKINIQRVYYPLKKLISLIFKVNNHEKLNDKDKSKIKANLKHTSPTIQKKVQIQNKKLENRVDAIFSRPNRTLRSLLAMIGSCMYIMWTKNKESLSIDNKFINLLKKLCGTNNSNDDIEINLDNIYVSRFYLKISKLPDKISLSNLIELLCKSSPFFIQPICALIYEFINRNPTDINNYSWILNEIAKICCGTNPDYLRNIPFFSESKVNESLVKTSGVFLVICSELIQICRSFLLAKNETFIKILQHILKKAFTSASKKNKLSIYNGPILLYAVFAILSNIIEITRVNSFIKLVDSLQTYYVSEIGSNEIIGWQIPITPHSEAKIIAKNYKIVNNGYFGYKDSQKAFTAVSAIPFTFSMFPFTDPLFPFFLKQFSNDQPKTAVREEALSFYILSCLKEYCNDSRFLNLFLKHIPNVSISQILFGNTKDDFISVLRLHLSINSDGFLPNIQITPHSFFMYSSPSNNTCNSKFVFDKNSIKNSNGISVFISTPLRFDEPTSLKLNFSINSKFDCGIQTFSSYPNSNQIVLYLAHDPENIYSVGTTFKQIYSKQENNRHIKPIPSQQKAKIPGGNKDMFMSHNNYPRSITIEYTPSSHQGVIYNTDNNEKISSIIFNHNIVAFVLYLYGESSVNYMFIDNETKSKIKSKLKGSWNVNNSGSLLAKLPSLEPSKILPLDNKEWNRFDYNSSTIPKNDIDESELITFSKELIKTLSDSSRITKSLEKVEPISTISVNFTDSSFGGFQLDFNSNVKSNSFIYKSLDENNYLQNIFDLKDGVYIDDSTGKVSNQKDFEKAIFVKQKFLPPIHFLNFGIIPPSYLNYYIVGVVDKFRNEMKCEILMRIFSNPSINFNNIMKTLCPSTESIVYFALSLLVYIEPINIKKSMLSNKSSNNSILVSRSNYDYLGPINYSHNTIDGKTSSNSSLAYYRSALNHFISYMSNSNVLESFINAWFTILKKQFSSGFSHSVCQSHPYSTIINYYDFAIPKNITVFHKNAVAWVILPSGFKNDEIMIEIICSKYNSDSKTNNETVYLITNNAICIEGDSFVARMASPHDKVNSLHFLVCIPIFADSNESLFGTVFDLIISMKYFIFFFKMNSTKFNEKSRELSNEIKIKLYAMFIDSLIAQSPYFISYGRDIFRFLQKNFPITVDDFSRKFVVKLSLLSIYTNEYDKHTLSIESTTKNSNKNNILKSSKFAYIKKFIQEQQVLLEEHNMQNKKNENENINLKDEETKIFDFLNLKEKSSVKFLTKSFEFLGNTVNIETINKCVSNFVQVLTKQKDIKDCPLYLLFYHWGSYAHLYPCIEVTKLSNKDQSNLNIMKANEQFSIYKINFTFFVPNKFKIIWKEFPAKGATISFSKNFSDPIHLNLESIISTSITKIDKNYKKGKTSENFHTFYLQINENDNIDYYIKAIEDDNFEIESFVKKFKTQFLLDSNLFFIYWDAYNDQRLLNCFSQKIFYKSTLCINNEIDPLLILNSKLNLPVYFLCCRCYFLFLLNFYYVHNAKQFNKETILYSLLPSIMLNIKLEKFLKNISSISKPNLLEDDNSSVQQDIFEIDSSTKRTPSSSSATRKLNDSLIYKLTSILSGKLRGISNSDLMQMINDQSHELYSDLNSYNCNDLINDALLDFLNPDFGYIIEIPDVRNENENSNYYFIPIPHPQHRNINEQYKFIGALLSIAITQNIQKDFHFPPLFWDYMLNKTLNYEQIFEIDHEFGELIHNLKKELENNKITQNSSSQSLKANQNNLGSIFERYDLRFVVKDARGEEKPLIPNGFNEKVNLSNCETFIHIAMEFRLKEIRENLEQIREGLWEGFNIKTPKYIDWETLEFAACGPKEITIETLKNMVIFKDVPEDHQMMFWYVMNRFTNEQKSLFLKFVTGKVRYSFHNYSEANSSNLNMISTRQNHSLYINVDYNFNECDKIPTATNCFNQLHLSKYSSEDVMYHLMSIAIENINSNTLT